MSPKPLESREKILSILKDYGEDTLSYFHLQHNRLYFFSPTGKSFLSYKVFNKIATVAADPVGPAEEIPLLLTSFLNYMTIWKITPCFVGLSNKYIPIIRKNGLRISKIGEEAIIHLDTFEVKKLKKKVRRAVRHVEELGVEVFFFNPITIPQHIREQIEDISTKWLKGKGGGEKGFSMTLRRIPDISDRDCQIVVAEKNAEVLGYICFAPAYQTRTLSLDQARRAEDAPNGLNEFLLIKSAEYFKSQHVTKLSLNFATFSNTITERTAQKRLKKAIFALLGMTYKSNSLRNFNEKFCPLWESRYIAYPSLKHLPLYILAILRSER